MAGNDGAAAVHRLIQHSTPALLPVAGKQKNIRAAHGSAHLLGRHKAGQQHPILQPSRGNLALQGGQLLTVADHGQGKVDARLLQGVGGAQGGGGVLPVKKAPCPQKLQPGTRCGAFAAHQGVDIAGLCCREIPPAETFMQKSTVQGIVKRGVGAGRQKIVWLTAIVRQRMIGAVKLAGQKRLLPVLLMNALGK